MKNNRPNSVEVVFSGVIILILVALILIKPLLILFVINLIIPSVGVTAFNYFMIAVLLILLRWL